MRQSQHETNCLGDWKAVFIQAKSDAFYLKFVNLRCFVPGFVGVDVFQNLPLKINRHVSLGYFAMWKKRGDYLFTLGTFSFSSVFSKRTLWSLVSQWNCFSQPFSSKLHLAGLIDALSAPANNGMALWLQPISYQLHVLLWESENPTGVGSFWGW